jgi:hypothetical protein
VAYGLTPTGFNLKPTAQVINDIAAALLANLSPTLNLGAASALGQLIGIIGADQGELWQQLQAIESAFDPNKAAGDQLSSLSLITGTKRRGATNSVAKSCTVNINPGTYAAGALTSYPVGNPAAVFANVTPVTNSGGSAANFSVDFKAITAGPVLAPANTLTVIASPISGFNSITNPTDALVGLGLASDAELRQSRAAAIQGGGSSTAGAIRSAILNNLGVSNGGDVINCTVVNNDKDITDVNGLPPHSFEAIVVGALSDVTADAAIAAQIAATKTAGDTAFGFNRSIIVNDSQGNPHNIGFTRPTTIPIYVAITVQRDPLSPYTPTVAAIQAALVAWAQAALGAGGQSVIIERIKAVALSVPGALDVPAAAIGTSPSPVGTANIPVNVRQIAMLSSSNIVVTIT